MSSSSAPGTDFLTQYRWISNKLKRRFLRKPNVAEASEQFSLLAKQQQEQECPQYAALSCLALARCEQNIGNSAGEAQALIQAARLFLEEEMQNFDLKCATFNEYLNAAINCFNHAIRVYTEQNHSVLAAGLCIELGTVLEKMEKTSEAITYYEKADECLANVPLETLNVKDLLAGCFMKLGDYDTALSHLTAMSRIINLAGKDNNGRPFGAYVDYLMKSEIGSVLLLLLLSPGPQRLQPEHSQLLEKYAWENTDFDATACWMGEELFLLLQSVVMAHQSNDVEALVSLQIDLWYLIFHLDEGYLISKISINDDNPF
ncbi:coagulation factor VIII-associated [Chamberlinius hualienensis]